ncbi:MAG: L-threonylcarbamoyladenylate synthase, partial [Pyrinomonadaceae bacterium]|nr:L-threonylcarbamoyladenylate synthase [Pyrinomonadaceae bacterium]
METLVTSSAEEAARIIKAGGVVAFPTETVFGLGANVFDEEAIQKIFAAKQRPGDNPLIAHIGDISEIGQLAESVPECAVRLIKSFFPGPLTIVLKKRPEISPLATAGLDSIGIRMPGHALAHEFLTACGVPVVAPSANISGKPSPTTWRAVYEDLGGRIDCILQGEATEIGLESTVVDCTAEPPEVLRLGAVTLDDLRQVVPEMTLYLTESDNAPRSPGMKHRHYSPRATVVITDGVFKGSGSNVGYIGLDKPELDFTHSFIATSVEDYGKNVFEFFRECDRRDIALIYCQRVPDDGLGAAL